MGLLERIDHRDVDGIRVGRYGRRLNTSCFVYRYGDTLIDCGPPNQWRVVWKFASESELNRILLTHHHEDHCGNAMRLSRRLDVDVLAPEKTIPLVRDGFRLRPYQRVVWGRPKRFEPKPVPDIIDIGGSGRLQTCATPGHAADLTCYLEPDKGWLFSSDLFVARKPRYLRSDEKPHREIKSIGEILQLEFDSLFCAHRGLVPNGKQALRDKRDYLLELRDKIRSLNQKGLPVDAIAKSVLGKEDLTATITGGHYNKENYVRAFLQEEQGNAT